MSWISLFDFMCIRRVQIIVLFFFSTVGMATNNQLPVFWTSWFQFPVQYDFSVSFSGPSLTSFSILHIFCCTSEAW